MNDNLDQLAAALNGHQITDDTGALTEETTSDENTATQETNTVEESATAEKSAESQDEAPNASGRESENELAEDETGKRYVPEGRFKEVYGKAKQTERELADLKAKLAQGNALLQEPSKTSKRSTTQVESGPAKADVLELKLTLPQFDPRADENGVPTNPEYSQELDGLGFQIWKANPGMSLLDAGRQALKLAKSFSSVQTQAASEARLVKTSQSDNGITTRVISRGNTNPKPEDMTLEQKEAWLKANGQW